MTSIWKRRSTWVFFAIAFGVPWCGWITANLLAAQGYNGALLQWLFYAGDFCSVAGFVATYVDEGRAGIKDLIRRCFRWRPGVGWWLYSAFLPVLWTATAVVIWGVRHGGVGHVRPLQAFALIAPARFWRAFSTGPLGEEAGWRGFLLPRMLQRYQPLKASLILGVIWSFWHVPLYFRTMIALPNIGLRFLLTTVAYSVLMTMLFLHARGSVLLCMILHYTINAWPPVAQLIFPDVHANTQGPAAWISAGVLFVITIAVAICIQMQVPQMQVPGLKQTVHLAKPSSTSK